jgi:hypothetical protein
MLKLQRERMRKQVMMIHVYSYNLNRDGKNRKRIARTHKQ